MATAYRNTTVQPHKTQADIEALLRRHSVDAVRWTSVDGEIVVEFRRQAKDEPPLGFRMSLKYPLNSKAQYLRALYWYVKSKIEAIEFGIVSFEQAFMPDLLVGPERTIGDEVISRLIERSLGQDVPLLPERATVAAR